MHSQEAQCPHLYHLCLIPVRLCLVCQETRHAPPMWQISLLMTVVYHPNFAFLCPPPKPVGCPPRHPWAVQCGNVLGSYPRASTYISTECFTLSTLSVYWGPFSMGTIF